MLRRFHVTGGPGSGKTTLARLIAARTGAPVYFLDRVCFENGVGNQRPAAVRQADVAQIITQPTWVTEGIYLGWTAPLLAASDAILWLDIPWRIAAWRIFSRHLKAELRGDNPHKGWIKLFRFMHWSGRYYTNPLLPEGYAAQLDFEENRAVTERCLVDYAGKVLRCTTEADVRRFLNELG